MIWKKEPNGWLGCYLGEFRVGIVQQLYYRDRFQPYVPTCQLPGSPPVLSHGEDMEEAILAVEGAIRSWFSRAGLPLEEDNE